MGRFDGKRVVITGGGSGIGFATARLMINEGARVLVTGRSEANLAQAGRQLGENAITVRSDASLSAARDALADRVQAEFGAIDALFLNAGINGFAPLEATSEELYDELALVNARAPYFTAQKLAPLVAQGGGIVFTTSVANLRGLPMVSAYAMTKAAVRSLTRSLASELLERGVRVNAVSPGPIDSGILEKSMPKEAAAQMLDQMAGSNPMKRVGRPEEIAAAVAFLAFDATFCTGFELIADGGATQL